MKREASIGPAIFVFALILRLIGIGWGLPNDLRNQSLHPDETVVYSNFAYRIDPASLQFMPGNYNYPTLYPILLRVAGDMASTYSGVDNPRVGRPPASPSEVEPYLVKQGKHERVVNIAGRVLNCLAGAGTAALVFFLLLRVTTLTGALFGGLLAAVGPALVVHSRFQTVDITSTFFLVAAVFYAVKLLPTGEDRHAHDLKHVMLSGLFAGLSAGTKYTGFLALLSLWVALVLRKQPGALKLAAIGLVTALAAFLITTPGVIGEWDQFIRGVRSESSHMRTGHGFAFVNTPQALIYHLGNVLTGLGFISGLVGSIGLIGAAIKHKAWAWVILAVALPYFLLIGTSEVKFMRYALPLLPLVACGFGAAIGAAAARPNMRRAGLAAGTVGVLGLESLLLSPVLHGSVVQCFDPRFGGVYGSVCYTAYMLQEDPRDQAARYLKALAAQGQAERVGLYRRPWFWTVPVIKDANYLYVRDELSPLLMSLETQPKVQYSEMSPPADHVAWSAFEVDPIRLAATNPNGVPADRKDDFATLFPEFKRIDQAYTIERTFGGDVPEVEDMMYIHPRVEVLRRR